MRILVRGKDGALVMQKCALVWFTCELCGTNLFGTPAASRHQLIERLDGLTSIRIDYQCRRCAGQEEAGE